MMRVKNSSLNAHLCPAAPHAYCRYLLVVLACDSTVCIWSGDHASQRFCVEVFMRYSFIHSFTAQIRPAAPPGYCRFGSFSSESLHACTVCIWRCEHSRYCVGLYFYAPYVNFHSVSQSVCHCPDNDHTLAASPF